MNNPNTGEEMEREFVSMITHQLKTPLAELQGFVENMLEGLTGGLNDKQKEYLRMMKDAVERSLLLVDDWLLVTKLDNGRMPIDIAEIRLADLIKEALEPLRVYIVEKDIVFRENYDESVRAMVDGGALRICIQKVMSRAIKTSPVKSTISLTVSASSGGGSRIIIADSGPAVEKDAANELFISPFKLLRDIDSMPRDKKEKIDMGFYIVSELMKLQKGAFDIRSGDVGVTAILNLP